MRSLQKGALNPKKLHYSKGLGNDVHLISRNVTLPLYDCLLKYYGVLSSLVSLLTHLFLEINAF